MLTNPVFFPESDWVRVPEDWSAPIVSGKGYDTAASEGARVWREVRERLLLLPEFREERAPGQLAVADGAADREDRLILTRVRMGQGAFRLLVTDAYNRRCAISGEKTLPVLEAAHIRSYAEAGPNAVSNGFLLRSDLHKLFDAGYITVTPEHRVEVSRYIKTEFENGREYYRYHGQALAVVPQNVVQLPKREFVEWHNEKVYRG